MTSPAPKQKMTVISIKMTEAFRDWLAQAADADRLTTVQLLERAAVEYVERRKLAGPAPKRVEGR